MTDARTAMMTGAILGLLKNAEEDNLLLLDPRPRLDAEGNYQNVIELVDANGRLVFTVTVELAVQPCPECRVGKHGNCDGRTWSDLTDDYATCPCSAGGHK